MSSRRSRVKRKTVTYFLFYVFTLFIMYALGEIFGEYSIYERTLGALSILACCWVAYKFRKNTSLFVCFFFVAYAVYSIVFGVYYFPEMRPAAMYTQYTDHSVYTIGMQCIFLYSISMVYLVKNGYLNKKINSDNSARVSGIEEFKPNWLVVLGCIFVVFFTSLTNYTYHGTKSRADITPLYEYRTVFFIAGMVHSRNSKVGKYIWAIIIILGTMPSLVGGNRAEAIPLIITYVYFYFDDVNPKKVFPIILAAVFLMIALGMFRQTLLSGGFNFSYVWKKLSTEKLTFDTAYWAYSPSLATIAISKVDGIGDKLELLWYQFLYILEGRKYNDKQLTLYTGMTYTNFGGYVSPVYFYYWIGLLSPIAFALMIYAYVKLYHKAKFVRAKSMVQHDLYKGVSAYFVATVPRWFLYGPFLIIRGAAIMAIGILVASTVSTVMLRQKRYRKLNGV